MRLLNVHTLAFTIFPEDNRPDYAIASHRWLDGREAMFEDVVERRAYLEGYQKVMGFAEYVRTEIPHLKWLWIDTCCIKQDSDRELSEAINSMFRWYREAEVCLAYLADVAVADDLPSFLRSVWFRRAWTLQELIAPELVVFLTRDWQIIGHKGFDGDLRTISIRSGLLLNHEIASATSIPEEILQDYDKIRHVSVEEKFEWSEGRSATRGEDLSYCLLGILDISMNIRYGDGEEKTRSRLLKKIAKSKEASDRHHVPFNAKDIPFLDHHVPREWSTDKLRSFFKSPNAASECQRIFIVHGMTGIGKTQLCAHFARTYHNRFSAVFWLDGSSRNSLIRSIAQIVPRLPGYNEDRTIDFEDAEAYRVHPGVATATTEVQMSKLRLRFSEWLSKPDNNRWLLILDDVYRDWPCKTQDPQAYDYQNFFDVNPLLPKIRHGNILITTTSDRLQGATESLQLQPMHDETARKMVEVRARRPVENIDLILPCSPGLPLSISLAAASLNDPDITAKDIASHIGSFSSKFEPEFVHHPSASFFIIIRDHRAGSMQDTLCKVMEASYSRLKFHESIAANLLKLWSILGCTDVSLEVMLMGNKVQLQRVAYTADEVVTEVDKSMIDSLLAFFSGVTKSNVQDQMDVLRRYALLPASEGKGSIRIHPMVRALCVQTTESPAVDGQLLSIAVTLVATLVKSSGYGQMLHGLAVGLPTYAKAIGNCISRLHFDENLAMDCLTIAEYLEQWEYSSELENLYLYAREALSVRAGSNLNHSTYKLAALYYNQGHIDKAERKLTLLLESVDEADYDTDTLLSCELLGSILAERDEPKKAQHFLERARVGFERTEGPWSSNTLRATRNMGHLALRQGWLRLAEQMFLLAREGPTSPSAMGTPLQSSRLLAASGLVETYVRFGRLELAEQTALSACEEAENLLGPNHASTFARYYTLALVNIYQRKLKQAKESYDKAVEGRNAILSKDHIDIYATFVHIAPGSFLVQGTAPALQYLVYEAFCALYPEHHPGSFVVLTSLAHLCHGQRRLQEADILCGEALRLQIRYLDTSHELVPMTMFCLGIILQDQGKMDQAIRTLICAIQGLERFPVSQRDLLLRAYRALGRACKSSNRSREADEVSRELQQLYDDASPRSLAKQHSLDYWLEALLFSIPMPYGASDNKFLVQAVESDATPQSKQAEGDRLEEASRKVGHRSRMWRKMFGDK